MPGRTPSYLPPGGLYQGTCGVCKGYRRTEDEGKTIKAEEGKIMPPHNEPLSLSDLLTVIAYVAPIIIAVVIATYQMIRVLRAEIQTQIGPIMGRLDLMENNIKETARNLREHNTSQDIRIEAITAAHNRLEGAHDAIIKMGVHSAICDAERK